MSTRSAEAFNSREKHTLPESGLEVELRKPDASRIIMESKKGEVPLPMKMHIIKSFNAAQQKQAGKEPKEEDEFNWAPGEDDLPEFQAYMDSVVRAALVFPRIVRDREPDYKKGEIDILDLKPQDYQYIFQWAMPEEAKAAETFHQEQTPDVGTVPTEHDLQPIAEPVA